MPISAPTVERPVWYRSSDALWFDPPGVARYRCTADTIDVTPIAGASRELIDALLVATALPAVLWLEGETIVLHASAVVPYGATCAVAIMGASGSGKSRLAAAMLARRARLVADDSIVVRWRNDLPICTGLAGGYHLGLPDSAVRPFHPVDETNACRSASLGTVVILHDGYANRLLTGVAAVTALLTNRHRPNVPRLCGREAQVLADVVRLARSVRVHGWSAKDADTLLDDDILRTGMSEG